jgi:hypothetical protein
MSAFVSHTNSFAPTWLIMQHAAELARRDPADYEHFSDLPGEYFLECVQSNREGFDR